MVRWIAGLLLLVGAGSARAQELPSDLARVPGSAIGFVHLQVGDALKTTMMKSYIDLMKKAGPAAFDVMEKRIVPSLFSIERVTFVIGAPVNGREPAMAAIFSTNKPFDADKLTQGLEKRTEGNLTWYADDRIQIAVRVFDAKTFMFGSPDSVTAFANGPKVGPGMAEALALAATGKKSLVLGLNADLIPPGAFDNAPPPFQPYLALFKAKTVHLSMDFNENPHIDLQARYADADAATEAEKAFEQAKTLGTQMLGQAREEFKRKLFQGEGPVPLVQGEAVAEIVATVAMLGMIERGKELLADLPLKREKEIVRLKVKIPEEVAGFGSNPAIMIALLVPAVQKVREAASRMQDTNNLKQIALAMHSYHDTMRKFPSAAICDKQGRPLLSWRVAVLPYLEEFELFKQFKLDEPWDSEHNKKLLPRMPKIYAQTGATKQSRTDTHVRVVVGPEMGDGQTIFPGYAKGIRLVDILDGTSNTILAVESETAVPWTKPDEVKYDPKGNLPRLLMRGNQVSLVIFADGSVRPISPATPEATLRALLSRSGGEVVPLD